MLPVKTEVCITSLLIYLYSEDIVKFNRDYIYLIISYSLIHVSSYFTYISRLILFILICMYQLTFLQVKYGLYYFELVPICYFVFLANCQTPDTMTASSRTQQKQLTENTALVTRSYTCETNGQLQPHMVQINRITPLGHLIIIRLQKFLAHRQHSVVLVNMPWIVCLQSLKRQK